MRKCSSSRSFTVASGTKNSLRYEPNNLIFVKVFNNILFKRHSSSTNRNDGTLYMIMGYLTFFRLEELAIEDYRKLCLS